jgi:hypothetical protein
MKPHLARDGRGIVRGSDDCQYQAGRELGLCSRVNICEWLINVVTPNKRKVLRMKATSYNAWTKNGKWSGMGAANSSIADAAPPAERSDLTYTGTHAERGKPDVLPLGRAVARPTDGAAGKGCRKKRKPRCNGADTGSRFARRESEQTSGRSLITR